MKKASNAKFPAVDPGATFRVPVPNVDRSKIDDRSILPQVLWRTENDLYELDTKSGHLQQNYTPRLNSAFALRSLFTKRTSRPAAFHCALSAAMRPWPRFGRVSMYKIMRHKSLCLSEEQQVSWRQSVHKYTFEQHTSSLLYSQNNNDSEARQTFRQTSFFQLSANCF